MVFSLIFQMSHGEVVVSKHKQTEGGKPQVSPTVGSASRLTLCSHGMKDAPAEVDPWLNSNPWGPSQQGQAAAPADFGKCWSSTVGGKDSNRGFF